MYLGAAEEREYKAPKQDIRTHGHELSVAASLVALHGTARAANHFDGADGPGRAGVNVLPGSLIN